MIDKIQYILTNKISEFKIVKILNSEISTFVNLENFISQNINLKNQINKDIKYLQITNIWASNSYCVRKKVGAIIVKDNSIISDGYNGTPFGFENECELDNSETKWYVLHAETNAITKLARSTQSSDGSTLYVSTSPCKECSKLIIQSGIKRVVFNDFYRDISSFEILIRSNIELLWVSKELLS